MTFTLDGKYLAQFVPGGVKLLETLTGQSRIAFLEDDVRCLVWSPNGKYLAVGTTRKVQIYQPHHQPHNFQMNWDLVGGADQVSALCWWPDGSLLITGHTTGQILIWKTSGKWPVMLEKLDRLPHAIEAFAWTPDGKTLVVLTVVDTIHQYSVPK
jgi:WD40 repeat protein